VVPLGTCRLYMCVYGCEWCVDVSGVCMECAVSGMCVWMCVVYCVSVYGVVYV